MKPTLIVQDDFLPDPDSLYRELVQEAKFVDTVSPADGVTYPNICETHQPLDTIRPLLAKLHGAADVDIKLSCYRLALAGEKDDTFCHADGIYAAYAAVLYLNPNHQNVGGTTFFRHASGIDRLPSDDALRLIGTDPASWHRWMTNQTQFENANQWQLSAFVGLKYNRLISYPTQCFHSRSPNDIAEPFGGTVETGRLIWVAFYDLVLHPRTPAIEASSTEATATEVVPASRAYSSTRTNRKSNRVLSIK